MERFKMSEKMLFCVFFEFGWIYGSILIVFSETMNRRMCNKTARFDRFRQLAPSQEAHILWMSPTLNKRWGDGRVHLQKWLSGHFFLIVKLSVMEFSKRAMKRKPQGQKTAINLQMRATAGFTARFATLLGQWSVRVTRRDHPFSGVRGQFGLHAHLILRFLWIDCPLKSKLCKIMHALFNAGYCSLSTEPRLVNPFPLGMRSLET